MAEVSYSIQIEEQSKEESRRESR